MLTACVSFRIGCISVLMGRFIVNQVGRSVNALGMGHLMAVLHYFYGVFGGRLRKRVRLRLKENAAVFLVD